MAEAGNVAVSATSHYLAACAIARDESAYLPEWVAYHVVVGFSHFTIYDNGSTIPVRKVLRGEVDRGLVRVIDFPGRAWPSLQLDAYNNYLSWARNLSKWTAFIDIDEFIVPKSSDSVATADFRALGRLPVRRLSDFVHTMLGLACICCMLVLA